MKKTVILFVLVLVLQSVLFGATQQDVIVKRLNDELSPVIEKDMVRFRLPGLSIAVVREGKAIWAKGFGFADREKRIAATPETVYRVGSISKLFNAVGVMLLEEQKKVSLDESIKTYIPAAQFENPFDTPAVITLRHILSHRAGLIREGSVGHYFDDSEPSQARTSESLFGTTLIYPPGTKTKYSNSGIGLSGYIAEKVTGMEYFAYQKKFVLQPLGMHSSGFVKEASFGKKIAKGYMRDINGKQWDAPDFQFGYLAAGNLYSNVLDMAKFVDLMCNEGKPLLRPETFRKMTTIQFQPEETTRGFGLGFMVSQIEGEHTLGHNGAVYGFSAALLVIPERNLGFICFTNLEGANGIDDKYIKFAMSIALEELADKKILDLSPVVELPLSELKRIAGRYENDDKVVRLAVRKGRLFLEPPVFRRYLDAISESEFVSDGYMGYGRRISVIRAQSRVTGIKMNNTTYVRVDEPGPNKDFAWNKLIGEYGPDINVMEVYEKDGELTVLIEWFYEYPLKHVADGRFAFPAGLYHGEELEFIESEGKVRAARFGGVTFKRRN